jgi:hypothetical protein
MWVLDKVISHFPPNFELTGVPFCRDPLLKFRPLSSAAVSEKRLQVARLRYIDARLGRDIAASCYMESSSWFMWRLWNWNEGYVNRYLVKFILCLHLGVTFLEPEDFTKLKNNGYPSYCAGIEALCLFVELQDCIGKIILSYHALPVRRNSVQNFQKRLLVSIALLFVLLFVFVDLVLSLTVSFSFEYYFPLKVLLVLFEVMEVR